MILPQKFKLASALEREGIHAWLFGGNAIELVTGRDLRPHEDVDFLIAEPDAARAVAFLEAQEFVWFHGSLADGDVFYRRGSLVVDLVPMDVTTDPPRSVGKLAGIAWPAGLFDPHVVTGETGPVRTLSPTMHLRMKAVVGEFFGVTLREKDLVDIGALEGLLASSP